MNCQEATKDLNDVRSHVESIRLDLEQRQRNVEAVLMEVPSSVLAFKMNPVLSTYSRQEFSCICFTLHVRLIL